MRLETRDVALPGLPPELDGLRIAHLSDFHLGVPGRTTHAVEKAVEWVEARQPDLTLVTGDLLTRASGEKTLRRLLPRLPRAYAILGNHDLAISRDPFVERTFLRDLSPATAALGRGRDARHPRQARVRRRRRSALEVG